MRIAVLVPLLALTGCGTFHPPPGGYYYQPPPPLETNPMVIRSQMQQQTYQPAVPLQQPQGQTATWTGKSSMGQSVTGTSIFLCEYYFAGQKFTRGYAGSCPATIQIQ